MDGHHEGDGLADDGLVDSPSSGQTGEDVTTVAVVGRRVAVQGPSGDGDEVSVALGGARVP